MSIRVLKFGGSNLRERGDVARLGRVIRSYGTARLVVVVSALYGVTDRLLHALDDTHLEVDAFCRDLLRVHLDFAGSCLEGEALEGLASKLEEQVQGLERFLHGVRYLGEVPPFVRDRVLSAGERLSAQLLTCVLQQEGLSPRLLLPEEMGLVCDGVFADATLDLVHSSEPVQQALAGVSLAVVPGFYAVGPDGRFRTLGRGGTDHTAAGLAHCLSADSLDLWKDVPGFMSADPRQVPSAQPVRQLSYLEAAELSYFGARILHPRTFAPLVGKGIPLRLFNICTFEGTLEEETRINGVSPRAQGIIKSVSYADDFGILQFSGPAVGVRPGIVATISDHLHRASVNIRTILTSQTRINMLLGKTDLEKAYHLVGGTTVDGVERIRAVDGISVIAAVGEGVIETPGLGVRLMGAVSALGINLLMVSMGASPVAIYLVLEQKDRQAALQAIHREFFHENH